jgi:hypothetical protein
VGLRKKKNSFKLLVNSKKIGYGLKPNCGNDVNLEDFENVEIVNNLTETVSILLTPKIVYFHLGTSGFRKCTDNLQTTAKCEEIPSMFLYINPSKSISPSSTEVTGKCLSAVKE